jgi:hypothetical protein
MTTTATIALAYLACAIPAGVLVIAACMLSSMISTGKVRREMHPDPHVRQHRITTTDPKYQHLT